MFGQGLWAPYPGYWGIFLARKNAKVWGDCPANQLASPSPQASLFRAAYAFRGYANEMH